MEQEFEDIYGYNHITTTEIARGGQGVVFRTQNSNIAVKVLCEENGTLFSKDLNQNTRLESIRLLPIPRKSNITLPQATLKNYAGYVMTLLEEMKSFESVFDYLPNNQNSYLNEWLKQFLDDNPEFVNFLGQYIKSGGRRRRIEAYFKVACILAKLHTRGLVYGDFSSKNAFISEDLANNVVWLIDSDNINYQTNIKESYFTPGYGAPEVMQGKGCTFYSDSYAFAVSLFWQLVGTHPFKGILTDENLEDDFVDDAEEKAYSGELPWIMDEENDSNRGNTAIPPDYVISTRLQRLFSRTFSSKGKELRHTRPTLLEWSNTLAQDIDLSVKCSHCGMDYDYSLNECPWCDTNNAIVILNSTIEGNDLWKFVREPEGELIIPLRLIRGFRISESDEVAFSLKKNKDSFELFSLYDAYEWSVSIDKGITFINVYGHVTIPVNCLIRAKHRVTQEQVLIEVEYS